MRGPLSSKACALWTVPIGLCPAPLLNWNPDFSLISHIGPPLYDKTGSYFYLDKELQVMCLSSPWDETDWQRSAPLIMGFPAPIYFWISVSPTPPSSNNRLVSWHDGESFFFRKANKHPRNMDKQLIFAKEQVSPSVSWMLFPFVHNFAAGHCSSDRLILELEVESEFPKFLRHFASFCIARAT